MDPTAYLPGMFTDTSPNSAEASPSLQVGTCLWPREAPGPPSPLGASLLFVPMHRSRACSAPLTQLLRITSHGPLSSLCRAAQQNGSGTEHEDLCSERVSQSRHPPAGLPTNRAILIPKLSRNATPPEVSSQGALNVVYKKRLMVVSGASAPVAVRSLQNATGALCSQH
jgi:hypothetical protein